MRAKRCSDEILWLIVLAWAAASPGMTPTEQVWDALDLCLQQRVSASANNMYTQMLSKNNIPQSTLREGDVRRGVR